MDTLTVLMIDMSSRTGWLVPLLIDCSIEGLSGLMDMLIVLLIDIGTLID